MSREYVANPHDIVRSGDIVTVRVVEVDASRRRISLSLLVDEGDLGRSDAGRKKTNKRS
ncbi:MAG: S1 RNA-binding domain-containing protein [Rothia dentocariosa]